MVRLAKRQARSGLLRNKHAADVGDPGPYLEIIAFDPGVTTGWCVTSVHPAFFLSGGVPLQEAIKHIAWGEVRAPGTTDMEVCADGEVKAVDELVGLCDAWPHAAICIEDFILRTKNKAREAISPVRITAMVRYGAYPRRIWLQQSALAMTTFTDERLRRIGLYDAHSGPHARDAVRHNLLLLRRVSTGGLKKTTVWPWIGEDAKSLQAAVKQAGRL